MAILDLAVAQGTEPGEVYILLGNGSGGFTTTAGSPVQAGGDTYAVGIGDFTGDGIQDLVTTSLDSNTVTILPGNGSGGFAAGTSFSAGSYIASVAVADFNGDGIEDIAAPGNNNNNVTVLLGAVSTSTSTISSTLGTPTTFGTTVPLSLSVSDTAFNSESGTVTFKDGATTLGTPGQNTTPYTFNATGLAVGSHTFTAVYAGGLGISGSTSNTLTFQVNQASQTITFGNLSTRTFGASPFGISATSTSGLTVAFTSSTTGVCTVSGTTVTLVAPGMCSITASQAGNADYTAASNVVQSFTVLATQTITFNQPLNVYLGVPPFSVASYAYASSALPAQFTSNSTGVCTATSTNGATVTILTSGTCSITASQPGNATYASATSVTQTFTVATPTNIFTVNSTSDVAAGGTINSQSVDCTTARAPMHAAGGDQSGRQRSQSARRNILPYAGGVRPEVCPADQRRVNRRRGSSEHNHRRHRR